PDQRVDVVGRNVACGKGSLARSTATIAGKLIVSAISGTPGFPAGFATSGLIAGSAAGAATATSAGGGGAGAGGAAAGAAGGGISGTALAIAGGVVAAGAGVAVATGALGGGDGDQGSCCHTGVFSIAFTPG